MEIYVTQFSQPPVLSSVGFHSVFAHVELKKRAQFLFLGIKFRDHAKEEFSTVEPPLWEVKSVVFVCSLEHDQVSAEERCPSKGGVR